MNLLHLKLLSICDNKGCSGEHIIKDKLESLRLIIGYKVFPLWYILYFQRLIKKYNLCL